MLKMKLSEVFHDYEIWKHGSGKNAFFTVEAWGDEIAFQAIEEARNLISAIWHEPGKEQNEPHPEIR